jgi:hypothetical protein
MKTKKDKAGLHGNHASLPPGQKSKKENNNFSGYPVYPDNEDIYSKYREEKDINPEDISKTKETTKNVGRNNEKDFNDDLSGNDLDIPGAELDDNQEDIGSEDEENNYYSLGGNDQDDPEEDKR